MRKTGKRRQGIVATSQGNECYMWLTSGIAAVWRRWFPNVREPDEGYREVEGVFLFWHRRGEDREARRAWREAEAEGCYLDYPSHAGVAWDSAPDAGVRVALCGITVVDIEGRGDGGSELWRPRPGVPEFRSAWATYREPVRWYWTGGVRWGWPGKWWDGDADEEARRALESRGERVVHYQHSLVPVTDRTAWEGAMGTSWTVHEHSVPLLVLRNLTRVSEVAAQLRQPEAPRIPDLIEGDERFIGVTVAVDQGDISELMIASRLPFDAPDPHTLEPIKVPRGAV